jgi:hypothetical protein
MLPRNFQSSDAGVLPTVLGLRYRPVDELPEDAPTSAGPGATFLYDRSHDEDEPLYVLADPLVTHSAFL